MGKLPRIQHTFHALALDERRYTFTPTMWYLSDDTTTDLVQCWFPGYHSDVGGATTEGKKDVTKIDEITFVWICDQVAPSLDLNGQSLFQHILSRKLLETWGKGRITDSMSLGYCRALAAQKPENQAGTNYGKARQTSACTPRSGTA